MAPSLRVVAVAGCALVVGGTGTAWAAKSYSVKANGTVKLHHREPATKTIEQRGTVRGTPFGSGSLVLRSKLVARKKLSFSVRLTTKSGVVRASGTADVSASGSKSSFRGTMRIDSGSGSYRKISRRTLNVSGSGDAQSRSTVVNIAGSIRY